MIYLDANIDQFDLEQALATVSPQRRAHVLRYRNERDQRLCLAAYRLLQQSLRVDYGVDDPRPEFIYDDNGKPLLKGHPGIHFSMSHCHEAAVLAIDNAPVGIDIETCDNYSLEVAASVMSEAEMRQILESPYPAHEFTRLWTMKESLYKLTGDDNDGDIRHMLDKMPPVIFETIVFPHSVCSVCSYDKTVTS